MTDIARNTERLRLTALRNYKVLDTPREAPFDRIARLAKTVLHAPVAQISFVDQDRQWLKSSDGLILPTTPRAESFCAYTIAADTPLLVADARADARFRDLRLVTEAPYVRCYMGVPLRTPAGLRIGSLCVMDTKVREASAEEVGILQDLAQLVMDELELRLVATTDSLTGALSRRAFLKAAVRDINCARRKPRDLSCILLDLDHFKSINDHHGNAAGDRALQEVALLLRTVMRGDDYLGRIGGEEFAVMLPGAGRPAAFEVGDRLRRRVMDAALALPDGEIKLTVSIGIATLNATDAGIEDLMRRADTALFAAKSSGRNRLVSADRAPVAMLVR
jgi:diguanylate cyclase (GGDEF)-like protein